MQRPDGVRLPQDRETAVWTERGPAFAFRVAYARSADTRAADDVGQDYLTLWHDASTFVFALCDGVGQSFYGDLAARFLGDALVDWLEKCLTADGDQTTVRTALAAYLHALVSEATELVEGHPLPDGLPPMVRDVLEEKRRTSGSQSTFVCGRLDQPGTQLPDGRVVLAWMGDSRLRVWGPGGEWSSELGTFAERQRWSSRSGPVNGEPNVFVGSLREGAGPGLTSLVAYSDGLAALDRYPRLSSNVEVQRLIDHAGLSDTSDDIAFLEVRPKPVPAHSEARPSVPVPELLPLHAEDERLHVSWRPVPSATVYEIEVRNGKVETWQTDRTGWHSAPLPPNSYRLRVRALSNGVPGPWSETRTAKISPASPPQSLAKPEVGAPTGRSQRRGRVVVGGVVTGLVIVLLLVILLPWSPLHRLIKPPVLTETPVATSTSEPTVGATSTALPTSTSAVAPLPSPTSIATATVTATRRLVATPTPRVVSHGREPHRR